MVKTNYAPITLSEVKKMAVINGPNVYKLIVRRIGDPLPSRASFNGDGTTTITTFNAIPGRNAQKVKELLKAGCIDKNGVEHANSCRIEDLSNLLMTFTFEYDSAGNKITQGEVPAAGMTVNAVVGWHQSKGKGTGENASREGEEVLVIKSFSIPAPVTATSGGFFDDLEGDDAPENDDIFAESEDITDAELEDADVEVGEETEEEEVF